MRNESALKKACEANFENGSSSFNFSLRDLQIKIC